MSVLGSFFRLKVHVLIYKITKYYPASKTVSAARRLITWINLFAALTDNICKGETEMIVTGYMSRPRDRPALRSIQKKR